MSYEIQLVLNGEIYKQGDIVDVSVIKIEGRESFNYNGETIKEIRSTFCKDDNNKNEYNGVVIMFESGRYAPVEDVTDISHC